MNFEIINIAETDSTNRWLQEHKGEYPAENIVVTTHYQTAGRGQGCNSWESEKGKNLLTSVLVHPTVIKPSRQFLLSMCGALAVKETVEHYVNEGITLKWPNDIYWNDRKLSGTLIETSIHKGILKDCIFGVGLNVNQTVFRSNAPNPVSIAQITGQETDLEEITKLFSETFFQWYDRLISQGEDEIMKLYHSSLYRKEGFFRYEDHTGEFEAELTGVYPDGHLLLRDTSGKERKYAFKEVNFIL